MAKSERFDYLEIPDGHREVPEEEGKDAFNHLEAAEKKYYEGLFELALREYSKSLQYDKGLVDAWVGQVKCLLALGETEEAETWGNNALNYFPKSADLLAVKAVVLCELGKSGEALLYSDDSLNLPSQTGYPWIARGNVLFFFRHEKTAIQCLEKVVAENPGDWRVLAETGRVFARHKKCTKAAFYFDRSVQIKPDNAYLWFQMAKCYRAMRSRSMCQICCERALEIKPDYPDVQEFLNSHRGACFIATVCFQNSQTEEIILLRGWRDCCLEPYPVGRFFVNFYYRVGPELAEVVKRIPFLRIVIRFSLRCLIRVFIEQRHVVSKAQDLKTFRKLNGKQP
jgi:tetratricopeptide (TPR) repeat protein